MVDPHRTDPVSVADAHRPLRLEVVVATFRQLMADGEIYAGMHVVVDLLRKIPSSVIADNTRK